MNNFKINIEQTPKIRIFTGGRSCEKLAKVMLETEKDELQHLIDYQIRERDFFQLKELQTMSDIVKIYSTKEKPLNRKTLDYKLKFLDEGYDYIKLGKRLPTLLTPKGVEKLLNVKGVEV